MKTRKAILISLFGIFAGNSKADTGLIVNLHPLSSMILAPFGAYYGKISLEYDAFGIQNLTTAISGYHGKKNSIEKTEYIYDESIDTIDFTKNQISIFMGKRFYLHPLYIQPTINFGYYEFKDKTNSSNNINNVYAGTLLYFGTKFTKSNFEWGFDVGGGVRLFGMNRFDMFGRVLLDADATIGYKF